MNKNRTSQEIRRGFLNYFKNQGHAVIPSSPVIPHDDPTLLFINAGMNQFKDVFLGASHRDYTRAVTTQKCIRAGGKHNDLENVGHTKRHLTFFEMLGNFSFGDYFKEHAIQSAWQVSTEIFGFDPDRIWPTIFRDDEEAFELWQRYVPASRITRMDEKDNFWAMGDTGPCGPCSELLYDRGEAFGAGRNPKEDVSGERYLEFWNLVFMQYNRLPGGVMEPLPKPSIDTGSGLERVMSLLFDVDTVFDTDILRGLIAKTEEVLGKRYDPTKKEAAAFRVIADHLRTLSFAITDGAQPSNVERGYVLRKILRRAVRYARQLCGIEEPFLARILPRLVELMGDDFPELKKAQGRIAEILTVEEEAFQRTLRRGQNMLGQIIEYAQRHGIKISGDDAFKLKDTYGFPLDEIQLIAVDAGLTVDEQRYQQLEQEARERSKRVHKTTQQVASESLFASYAGQHGSTVFLGYTETACDATIKAIVVDGAFVDSASSGQEATVLLDRTPFYAEMGGQVGDKGRLEGRGQRFQVNDTQAPYKGIIAHVGTVTEGNLKVGDRVTATIDTPRRQKIANNHTATHLLHWALHQVLGEHVKQGGSVVEPERLRFDFSHHKALTPDELRAIEDLVNGRIRENRPVQWYEMSYEDAQKRADIKQFFGEKYGSQVRVIDIDYSKELCGGTHTTAVGTIGLFRIAKEGSIAAGMRRIEALTGVEAEAFMREQEFLLNQVAQVVKAQPSQLLERVHKLMEDNAALAKELQESKKGQLAGIVQDLVARAETVQDIAVVAAELKLGPAELKTCADEAIVKIKSGVVILGATEPDKCSVLVRVSDDIVSKGIKANEIVNAISTIIDGKGGGKANAAQAGGKAPQRLGEALSEAKKHLKKLKVEK